MSGQEQTGDFSVEPQVRTGILSNTVADKIIRVVGGLLYVRWLLESRNYDDGCLFRGKRRLAVKGLAIKLSHQLQVQELV